MFFFRHLQFAIIIYVTAKCPCLAQTCFKLMFQRHWRAHISTREIGQPTSAKETQDSPYQPQGHWTAHISHYQQTRHGRAHISPYQHQQSWPFSQKSHFSSADVIYVSLWGLGVTSQNLGLSPSFKNCVTLSLASGYKIQNHQIKDHCTLSWYWFIILVVKIDFINSNEKTAVGALRCLR